MPRFDTVRPQSLCMSLLVILFLVPPDKKSVETLPVYTYSVIRNAIYHLQRLCNKLRALNWRNGVTRYSVIAWCPHFLLAPFRQWLDDGWSAIDLVKTPQEERCQWDCRDSKFLSTHQIPFICDQSRIRSQRITYSAFTFRSLNDRIKEERWSML